MAHVQLHKWIQIVNKQLIIFSLKCKQLSFFQNCKQTFVKNVNKQLSRWTWATCPKGEAKAKKKKIHRIEDAKRGECSLGINLVYLLEYILYTKVDGKPLSSSWVPSFWPKWILKSDLLFFGAKKFAGC